MLADTATGLTGAEIGHLLAQIKVIDVDPDMTKWKRLYNALATRQNSDLSGDRVLAFVAGALDPVRYRGQGGTFENRRGAVNEVLAFYGLKLREDGKFKTCTAVSTLSEAEQRADRLRTILFARRVHQDVLDFCRAELLEDNYFHAVLEATKSVAEKIRGRTGLSEDTAVLADQAFGGSRPLLKINDLITKSDASEQKGFCNLVKGLFGVFRHPTAHAPRIAWKMREEDALDLLTLASYIHRRIDGAT